MDKLPALFEQNGNLFFLLFVFLSSILFVFAILNMTSSWAAVRKRAASSNVGELSLPAGLNAGLLKENATGAALGFILPKDEKEKSALRQFMNLAGYYGVLSPAIFQLSRIVTALTFGLATPFAYVRLYPEHPFYVVIAASLVMVYFGYMLPRTFVSFRRDSVMGEHRIGFPDFLDLLVICVEAGIAMDAAIDRIGSELSQAYPSLSKNLKFMSMEMRAGRQTRDALENLAVRLGIEEARSFSTLIIQSQELGSSLAQSLRVYADEMRDKRMSRAEEKAQALPVKLVIPLGLFIFPVILGVTLFPVVLKLYKALGI